MTTDVYGSSGPVVTEASRAGAARTDAAWPWIQSARFDLALFVLSPLVALPVLFYAPAGPSLAALVVGCVIGVPHYLSTFTFFFWDDTRAQHRAQWLLFFGVPVLIVGTLACLVLVRVPFVIQVVLYVWNTYHVSRQSCGLLSMYRHRAGVRDPSLKPIVNGAVIATAFALAFWNVQYYPILHRFLTYLWPQLPWAVWAIATIIALVALARLAASLARRWRDADHRPRMPELIFLATSLLLFHPYLWIRDADRATLGMLLGHFIQYLGLVWLVHRRKFGESGERSAQPARAQGRPAPSWLVRLSTNLPLLLLVLVTAGGTFVVVRLLSFHDPALQTIYSGGFIALSLIHFYLDALFWAFRRPEVRSSLGPHLLGFGSRATAGAAPPSR